MPLKFTTGGKTYTAEALTRPTIRDYLNLTKTTEALGQKLTSADVFRIEHEIDSCGSAKERNDHPQFLMYLALIVWATLIEAGDSDPFDKAISTRLDDLLFFYEGLEPPQDPSKPRADRASVRGAKRPRAKSAAKKT